MHLLSLCFIFRAIQMAKFPYCHAQHMPSSAFSLKQLLFHALVWWLQLFSVGREGFQTHFLCFPRDSLPTSLHNYPQRRKYVFFFLQQSHQISFFSALVFCTFLLNTSMKSLLINTSLTARSGRCLVLGEPDFTRTLFTFHLALTPE